MFNLEALLGREGLLDIEGLVFHPLPVRSPAAQLGTDFVAEPYLSGLPFEEHHLTRTQLTGALRPCLHRRAIPRFRGHYQHLGGDRPAGRAETVSVHSRQERYAVRGSQRRGAVPRLGQRGMVLIEILFFRIEGGGALPSGLNEHLFDMGKRTAGAEQELEHVVQTGGIRKAGLHERSHIPGTFSPDCRADAPLSRLYPTPVGRNGVDLPVMGENAEGLGYLPCRRGVGRVTLMEDSEDGLIIRVVQVPIEIADPRRGEQTFVDHRPGRSAGDREGFEALPRPLHTLSRQQHQPLELLGIERVRNTHQSLAYHRHQFGGAGAERLRIGGHGAPSQQGDALCRQGLGHHPFARPGIFGWEKGHHHSQPTRRSHSHTPQIPVQ